MTAPPSPWLQPLPDLLNVADLPNDRAHRPDRSSTAPAPVPFALVDLPAEQMQRPALWDPVSDGHLGIVGAPRTGRSSLLRTLVAGALRGAGPTEIHLYGFDPSGALAPLSRLPHTGAWVGPDEIPRGMRVLELLAGIVAGRQRALAADGFTSIVEQRASAAAEDGPDPLPVVCLVVDGWPRFLEDYGEVDRGRGPELLTQVLREGPTVGVVALVTGDRTLLTSRIAPLLSRTWCLRMSDPQDLLMAGLSRRQVPDHMPAGRMVRLPDGIVAQAAVLGTRPGGDSQLKELDRLVVESEACSVAPDRRCRLPAYVRPLPHRVSLADLTVPEPGASDTGAPGGLLVGAGGDTAGPVLLPVDPSEGATALVSGPPRSGRTTALRTLLAAARQAGHPTLLVDADRAVRQPDAIVRQVADLGPGTVVAVDDVALLADGPVEDALLDWARSLPTAGGVLVVSGEPESLGGSYRGLVPLAARGRTGILLQPSGPADGAPLGISPGPGGHSSPGRGLLVARGRATSLQVALPGPDP